MEATKPTTSKLSTMLAVLAISGQYLQGATIAEFLFDRGISSNVVVNEIAGAGEPLMQVPTVAFTNLHVLGGPFSNAVPYHSVGMMLTPTNGNYLALGGGSAIDWTTKSQLTLEMWVNPSIYLTSSEDPLIHRGQGLRLIPSLGNYYLAGYIYTGSAFVSTGAGALPVATGVWSHIALTFDGATLRTYVNGTLDKSVASVSSLGNAPGGNLYIGAFSSGVNNFHGMIDEIRLSDLALPSGLGTGKGELAWNATLVPEPSTYILLSLASALWFARRNRRRF